ncbi:hypothetical protein FOZ62_018321 [Perkinsus olseni]|uniref:Uncharacterized protein n=1 Tax=Perkinsus olseni TaxID=32597 RepID=A0A7J6S6A8_PEROL|nr:hypothetical protein FOZ62_018321 [Perkinsus olseni]
MGSSVCYVVVALSTLFTAAMALQTASQTQVNYASHGVCRKQYSSSRKYPYFVISMQREDTYFSWNTGPNDFFNYNTWSRLSRFPLFPGRSRQLTWKKRTDYEEELAASKTVSNRTVYESTAGLTDRFHNLIAPLNPFDHLPDDLKVQFRRPLTEARCRALFDYVENRPPQEYTAGSEWIPKFVDHVIDSFLAKVHTEREREGKPLKEFGE